MLLVALDSWTPKPSLRSIFMEEARAHWHPKTLSNLTYKKKVTRNWCIIFQSNKHFHGGMYSVGEQRAIGDVVYKHQWQFNLLDASSPSVLFLFKAININYKCDRFPLFWVYAVINTSVPISFPSLWATRPFSENA